MWHNHPLSKKNKVTKRKVVVEVGGKMVGEWGWTKFEKEG